VVPATSSGVAMRATGRVFVAPACGTEDSCAPAADADMKIDDDRTIHANEATLRIPRRSFIDTPTTFR
jgi:hypothetical protein